MSVQYHTTNLCQKEYISLLKNRYRVNYQQSPDRYFESRQY